MLALGTFKMFWSSKRCGLIVEPMAGSVPPVIRHHSHAQLIVPPTLSPCQTRRSTYFSGMPMANKQTELSIFLEAHNVKVAAIHESKLTVQSRSTNIQNYTLVRKDLGPREGLLFLSITQSTSLTSHCQQRRRMTLI